ncbi:MAG: ester cyclase, partial [Candidatus Methanosuratus sp.]|nr:ester cyclase [Candidatus Methanosuratincola sp.]
ADEAADVIRSYVDAEVSWHGPHPINDLNGVDALLSEFWQPLLASFPDLHRTCEIFIGGHVHWVAAIGYFSGTFSRDWLGIPATGREMHIRFGEFSAVYRGKIVVTYIIPDLLDLIRQAGYQLVPPSLGKEGIITGPMTGDGVLLTPHDDAEGAKTLELAKVMCANLRTPQLDTFWDTERMMWYGPSGIGTTRGFAEFWDKHESPFDHAFPCYGTHFSGRHVAEVGEGNYAAWVGWPSIRAHHSGEYLGYPPTGRLVEWRLMDFYRREGNLIIENWVPVDMVHLFLTMGVDLFASLRSQVSSNPCTEVPAR